jgi:hypothetical protein
MAVRVETEAGFRTETPRRLFSIGPGRPWAAAGDHSRFLVAVRSQGSVETPLKVITHWLDPAR